MVAFQHIDVAEEGGTFWVRFKRHHLLVEEYVVRGIGQELRELASRIDCQKVVVDFVGVEDVSSYMIGQLVMLRKLMAAKKGKVALRGLSSEVREFFDETMLSALFDIGNS